MIKLVRFSDETTYMFPNGEVAPPSRIRTQFPAVDYFPHVLEINGDVCQAVMSLRALRASHNIDETLSDDQAITNIEYTINHPPEQPVTTDERIAAAMEFQNLMSL